MHIMRIHGKENSSPGGLLILRDPNSKQNPHVYVSGYSVRMFKLIDVMLFKKNHMLQHALKKSRTQRLGYK